VIEALKKRLDKGDRYEREAYFKAFAHTDWKRVATMTDEQIDYSDIPLLRDDFSRRPRSVLLSKPFKFGKVASSGAVVVTHNIREFARVVGLDIADWEIA